MENRDGLTVFQRDARRSVSGSAGHLDLGEATEPVVVSPDGKCVAWHRKLSFQSMSRGSDTFLSFLMVGAAVQTIVFPGSFPTCFAISDKGSVVALTGTSGSASLHLLAFDAGSREPRTDLTKVVSAFPMADIMEISVSGSGELCAIGSRHRVAIISIPLQQLVYQTEGHSPRISPEGDRLAFIEGTLGFAIRHLGRGTTQRMLPLTRVPGLGGWSPDEKYLIGGAFTPFRSGERLLVVDTSSGNSCIAAVLGMDDTADRFVWIHKTLLSS